MEAGDASAPPRQPCEGTAVVNHWAGRTGNQLLALERALAAAVSFNLCFVMVELTGNGGWEEIGREATVSWTGVTDFSAPPIIGEVVRLPEDGLFRLFPESPAASRGEARAKARLRCAMSGCIPFDAPVRLGTGLDGLGDTSPLLVQNASIGMLHEHSVAQLTEKGHLRCAPNVSHSTTSDTLVMHMRSGDVYHLEGSARLVMDWYAQPPCAFYKAAMREGNGGGSFDEGLIVTQPDLENPCVDAMREAFPGKIRVQTSSVTEDACALVLARSVALGSGTWGPSLILLNSDLQNLFIPFGGSCESCQGPCVAVDEAGTTYNQYVYDFPGLERPSTSGDAEGLKAAQLGYEGATRRVVPAKARPAVA